MDRSYIDMTALNPEESILLRLDVIEKLLEEFSTKFIDFNKYYIIGIQHILDTNLSLIQYLIQLGFIPNNIYIAGKSYSTIQKIKKNLDSLGVNIFYSYDRAKLGYYQDNLKDVATIMWDTLTEVIPAKSNIIIIDDGGYTISSIPETITSKHSIFGIEQTKSGINLISNKLKIPVINVAKSFLKSTIEPIIIAEEIMFYIKSKFLINMKIGIVGYGDIGYEIARFLKKDYETFIFDIDKKKYDFSNSLKFCDSLADLYNNSDVIIGVTGEDISQETWLENQSKDKILISFSSNDIEFNKILKILSNKLDINECTRSYDDIIYRTLYNTTLKIFRGGTSANFNNKFEISAPKKIQLTRGLMFAAILYILKYNHLEFEPGFINLCENFQKVIFETWIQQNPEYLGYIASHIKLDSKIIDPNILK